MGFWTKLLGGSFHRREIRAAFETLYERSLVGTPWLNRKGAAVLPKADMVTKGPATWMLWRGFQARTGLRLMSRSEPPTTCRRWGKLVAHVESRHMPHQLCLARPSIVIPQDPRANINLRLHAGCLQEHQLRSNVRASAPIADTYVASALAEARPQSHPRLHFCLDEYDACCCESRRVVALAKVKGAR